MAICGTCGKESSRVRSSWIKDIQQPDECPYCAPQSFEKQSDPSTRKIWVGPEFAPNDYEWRNGQQVMKEEAIQELEAKACGMDSVAAQDELEATRKAEEMKRKDRRTTPASQAEIEKWLAFADRTLRPLIEDSTTSYEI